MTAQESAERMYYILKQALGHNAEQRKEAEKALRDAEEKQDYFSSLASIATASDDQVEPNVRWLAAVCGKNAVFRSWRRRKSRTSVTGDERQYVRSILLRALGESHSTISTQISVWISYIARLDFPNDWPDLLTDLVQVCKKSDPNLRIHALITLDMSLKQLASRRLISHRQALYRFAPMVFSELHTEFSQTLQALLQNQGSAEELKKNFDVLVRCLKSFRRIINYGCQKLSDLPDVPSVMQKIVELPNVFMLGATGGTDIQVRLSHLASKLIRVTHERHPLQFQPYLPVFLKLYYETVIAYNDEISCDRTCFQAASFLRCVVQCQSYKINSASIAQFKSSGNLHPNPQGTISPNTCREIVLLFFDEGRTDRLIEAMITKIFVLSKREVETWAADPESLILDEEAAEWRDQSFRHECEELFKLLLIREKPRVVPKILQLADAVSKNQPLMLDACYRAVGRAVYDLQGAFDFEVWLNGHLGVLLQSDYSDNLGDRIIQARTAWLVSQFVEQLTRDSRRVVSPLLVRLLSFMDRDLVVALTALKAIQTLAEDLGFHAGDFAPLLQTCAERCFQLINMCETFESKRDILGTITCLVQRCLPKHTVTLVHLIASALPRLWDQKGMISENAGEKLMAKKRLEDAIDPSLIQEKSSGGEALLRASIIGLLSTMLRRIGAACLEVESLKMIVLVVLRYSLDMSKGGGGVYLVEEGCELWAAMVAASKTYTDELRALFQMTEGILGIDFDNLREVFGLIKSYILVGGNQFMGEYGETVKSILLKTIGNVRDRGCLAAVVIVDTILVCFGEEGVIYMGELLREMAGKMISKNESQVVTCGFASILARATLKNIEGFEEVVIERSEERCLEYMDSLIENIDAMYGLGVRKRSVMALCGLLQRYGGSVHVRERFGGVANVLVQVMSQEENGLKREKGKTNEFANMLARYGEEASGAENDEKEKTKGKNGVQLPEDDRIEMLKKMEGCEEMELRRVGIEMLREMKKRGQGEFDQMLRYVDSGVLRQLEGLLS